MCPKIRQIAAEKTQIAYTVILRNKISGGTFIAHELEKEREKRLAPIIPSQKQIPRLFPSTASSVLF